MVFKQPLQPARPNYRETMWIKGPSGLCCLEMWLGRAASGEGGGGEFGGGRGLWEGGLWEDGAAGGSGGISEDGRGVRTQRVAGDGSSFRRTPRAGRLQAPQPHPSRLSGTWALLWKMGNSLVSHSFSSS